MSVGKAAELAANLIAGARALRAAPGAARAGSTAALRSSAGYARQVAAGAPGMNALRQAVGGSFTQAPGRAFNAAANQSRRLVGGIKADPRATATVVTGGALGAGALMEAGSRPPAMPGLPTTARKVTQYPAGIPTGVGGGNAGASTASQWRAPAAPAVRGSAPAAPAPRPLVPGNSTTQIQVPPNRGRAARLNAAAQQAGAGVRYEALGDEIGSSLTPAMEEYYEQPNMAAWAKKNPVLADRLRTNNGLPPLNARTSDDAILRAMATGALDNFQGGNTDDAIAFAQARGAFDKGIPRGARFENYAPTDDDAIVKAMASGALDKFQGGTTEDAIAFAQGAGAFNQGIPRADELPGTQEENAQRLLRGTLSEIRAVGNPRAGDPLTGTTRLNFNPNRSYWGGSSVY